ncbi:PREDICTED: zinc finger MYM-type protein 1-like [Erythranthe guttata]|uniref:zinc finger MYM-type protein 1-like n=1 Tax=Erythranthe guttata TaxID=4155 RepID=UPI00064DACCC|nr:PREDICTED: zinc finger MYM-type protein 1-like [Erythranthe guttata]|eukprot:XP_012840864.1 PREDICTED: zinc finger MYM-type protein 1-like [Erythranthe guttata]
MTCAFLTHVGNHYSQPSVAVKSCEDLMTQSRHIDNVMMNQSAEQILKNRLRVKTSIDCVRWLAYQSCPFGGHEEGPKSTNPGNFIEMVKLLASYNKKVSETVLEKAHHNEIHVWNDSKGDIAYHCYKIDKARDESKKEKMALVLRFVDKGGVLQERFFDIVSVKDTAALTLKCDLSTILSHHALSVDNLRGQGYDGASNMRGKWNGLQALFLKDCPYAYYVHCFAHRLQLALVTASREVILVHQFFTKLDSIVNIVGASTERNGELNNAQQAEISRLISISELETVDGANFSQRDDADSAYTTMTSFQFVFILILMKEVMRITDVLCQALQQMELLTLSLALDPSNSYKSFNEDDICTLVEKYYPQDFTERERLLLKFQLQHYYLDVIKHPNLCQISTLAALCEGLAERKKFEIYYLVDRLIRLILLLPVSTATTERVFSVMKLTKTKLRNKMEDEFLGDCILLHIERDIADTFSTDSIIEDLYTMKDRRVHFN